MRSPVRGVREGQPARVQQLPAEVKPLLFRAVHRIADDGVPQILAVHADLVRPARLQKKAHEGVPLPVPPFHLPVRGGKPALFLGHDRHFFAVGRRPSDIRLHPPRSSGKFPSHSARYSRAHSFFAICSASERCAASFSATTKSPEVSLSMRCTIPGRTTPLIELKLCRRYKSPLTSVPVRFPLPACTVSPCGLFTTAIVAVLIDDRERNILRREVRLARGGDLRLEPLARRNRARRLYGSAARRDAPLVQQLFRRRTGDAERLRDEHVPHAGTHSLP